MFFVDTSSSNTGDGGGGSSTGTLPFLVFVATATFWFDDDGVTINVITGTVTFILTFTIIFISSVVLELAPTARPATTAGRGRARRTLPR